MKTVFSYLKAFYRRMAVGFSIKVVATLSELMLPYILSHILKNVIGSRVSDIVLWGGLMVLFSAIALVCNITANRMAAHVSRDFAENMRKDLFAKTLALSARQTDKFTIPSLESRITTDTYNVHIFHKGLVSQADSRHDRLFSLFRRHSGTFYYIVCA